ncbi:putative pentatricopeptide repeat-containing protein At1g64310 [Phragmites australis]|uniref:putative pentatricopeptide repeat-containing protein At1g64310 n=1 Tax=Phragmites australis TaxID=29695 RepID=UPI002D795783|nr:putative pentatricopeptide repeat-containing protein At1g64310 [Phragmites australis]
MRGQLQLLAAATSNGADLPLSHTKQLHARLLVASPSAAAPADLRLLLLRSYAARGDLASANRLLDEAPRPASPLLYNALIRAHARRLDLPAALVLFARMRRSATPPDAHTFACVIRACADCSRPDAVSVVHGISSSCGASSHPIVGSALVRGYAKLGLVDDARRVFDGLREPDLVLWNAMMSGYGYRGMWRDGLELFLAMRRAWERLDGYSMVGLVSCFSNPEALAFGEAVHGVCVKGGYDSGHHVRSALVTMYLRCGCMVSGQILFGNLPDADLVTWSSLITGLLQTGKYVESLDLFRRMCYTGRRPDSILIASVLSACASTAAISCTSEVHCHAIRLGADTDIRVSSSLVDAYAKCGFSEVGYWVFRQMPNKNSVMYNTVISNLGSHGFAMKAIEVLDEMVKDELRPDSATFSALLSACCHVGLLDEGLKLFRRMRDEFHIVVKMEHYVYMVRLLATFGNLKEAYDLIQTMSIQPDCGVWGALLWGCCVHHNSILGKIVAEKLFESYPDKAAYRIMLSNLYASQEMWWDAEEVRAELSKEDTHKNTGISWVGEVRK